MVPNTSEKWIKRILWTTLSLLFFAVPTSAEEIYSWRDHNGTTHFSDTAPDRSSPAQIINIDVTPGYRRVAKVIDGDTIVLEDGRRVRLLGIDAPEIAHHGQPGEQLGEKARRFLNKHLEGRKVRLRFDKQRRDHYHRLLAHLFLSDGTNVNAMLLEHGLAHTLFKWPNLKYLSEYYSREKLARQEENGIWRLPEYQIRPMKKLTPLRNRFIRLRGKLQRIQHKRRYTYLLFGNKLTAALPISRLPLFRKFGVNLKQLVGHNVILRGWLRSRDHHPFLKLEHPLQLEQFD